MRLTAPQRDLHAQHPLSTEFEPPGRTRPGGSILGLEKRCGSIPMLRCVVRARRKAHSPSNVPLPRNVASCENQSTAPQHCPRALHPFDAEFEPPGRVRPGPPGPVRPAVFLSSRSRETCQRSFNRLRRLAHQHVRIGLNRAILRMLLKVDIGRCAMRATKRIVIAEAPAALIACR